MSSKNSLIQIPWPRRVNSDISPSMLAPDESPVIRNIKTRSLPYDVRPRNGMKYVGTWRTASSTGSTPASAPASWIPYHAICSPDSSTILIGTVNQEANNSPDWPFYYSYQEAFDGAVANRAASGALGTGIQFPMAKPNAFSGDENIGWVTNNLKTGALTNGNNWTGLWNPDDEVTLGGQPVYVDNCVFFCKADWTSGTGYTGSYATDTKYFNSATNNVLASFGYRINRITQWGGKLNALVVAQGMTRDVTSSSGTALLTNGSTSFTFGATIPNQSIQGWIIVAPSGNSAALQKPPYVFTYVVRSHTNGVASGTLERPYGLGETTTNVPNYTPVVGISTLRAAPSTYVVGAPLGICTLALFNDRLFGARGRVSATLTSGAPQAYPSPVGEFGGDYPNVLMWSKPGNTSRWPDQNFALVGEDGGEPITGLATVGDKLIIFKPHRTYVMTGYDEDSFQIDKLSDTTGTTYPNGMVQFEGILYFCNQDGVWATDGTSVRPISQPQPGHGITALWNSRKWSRASGMSDHYFWPTMAVTPDAHLVVCCHYPLSTTDYADNFVYDIRNEAWSEWGMSNKTLNPIRVVTAPNGNVYGIHRWFITEITDCWNVGVTTPVYDEYPVLSTGTVTKLAVVPEIEVWFNASPGNTFRVNEMQLDHKVHYAHTSSGVTYTPWTIQFATDPDLVLSATQHSITARWTDSATYDATQPRHYSDRLPETYQREAQTMRVKLTGNTYPDANLRMKDWTLLAMKFTVSATRQMGIDNSTT